MARVKIIKYDELLKTKLKICDKDQILSIKHHKDKLHDVELKKKRELKKRAKAQMVLDQITLDDVLGDKEE